MRRKPFPFQIRDYLVLLNCCHCHWHTKFSFKIFVFDYICIKYVPGSTYSTYAIVYYIPVPTHYTANLCFSMVPGDVVLDFDQAPRRLQGLLHGGRVRQVLGRGLGPVCGAAALLDGGKGGGSGGGGGGGGGSGNGGGRRVGDGHSRDRRGGSRLSSGGCGSKSRCRVVGVIVGDGSRGDAAAAVGGLAVLHAAVTALVLGIGRLRLLAPLLGVPEYRVPVEVLPAEVYVSGSAVQLVGDVRSTDGRVRQSPPAPNACRGRRGGGGCRGGGVPVGVGMVRSRRRQRVGGRQGSGGRGGWLAAGPRRADTGAGAGGGGVVSALGVLVVVGVGVVAVVLLVVVPMLSLAVLPALLTEHAAHRGAGTPCVRTKERDEEGRTDTTLQSPGFDGSAGRERQLLSCKLSACNSSVKESKVDSFFSLPTYTSRYNSRNRNSRLGSVTSVREGGGEGEKEPAQKYWSR